MSFSIDSDFWLFQSGPKRQALGDIPPDEERGRAFARNLFGLQEDPGGADGADRGASLAGDLNSGRFTMTALGVQPADALVVASGAHVPDGLPLGPLPAELTDGLHSSDGPDGRVIETARQNVSGAGPQTGRPVAMSSSPATMPRASAVLMAATAQTGDVPPAARLPATTIEAPTTAYPADAAPEAVIPADPAPGLPATASETSPRSDWRPQTGPTQRTAQLLTDGAQAQPADLSTQGAGRDSGRVGQYRDGPAEVSDGARAPQAAVAPGRPALPAQPISGEASSQAAQHPPSPAGVRQPPEKAGAPTGTSAPGAVPLQTTPSDPVPRAERRLPDAGQGVYALHPDASAAGLPSTDVTEAGAARLVQAAAPDDAARPETPPQPAPARPTAGLRTDMTGVSEPPAGTEALLAQSEGSEVPAPVTPGKRPSAASSRNIQAEPEPSFGFAVVAANTPGTDQPMAPSGTIGSPDQPVLPIQASAGPAVGRPTGALHTAGLVTEHRAEATSSDDARSFPDAAMPDGRLPAGALFSLADAPQPGAQPQADSGRLETGLFSAGLTTAPQGSGSVSAPSTLATQQALTPTHSLIVATTSELPQIIGRATQEGDDDRIVVQLDPPELGRVSIDFKFDAGGLQHVTVTADTPEAMRQLRQMHFELVQALERNGLSGENMSFQQQNSQRHDGWSRPAASYMAGNDRAPSDGAAAEHAGVLPARQITADGRLNIKL